MSQYKYNVPSNERRSLLQPPTQQPRRLQALVHCATTRMDGRKDSTALVVTPPTNNNNSSNDSSSSSPPELLLNNQDEHEMIVAAKALCLLYNKDPQKATVWSDESLLETKPTKKRPSSSVTASSDNDNDAPFFQLIPTHPSPLLLSGGSGCWNDNDTTSTTTTTPPTIIHPTPHSSFRPTDIFLGRTRANSKHNRHYQRLLNCYRPLLLGKANAKTKKQLSQALLRYIRQCGGRFFVQQKTNSNDEWYELDDRTALPKLQRALGYCKTSLTSGTSTGTTPKQNANQPLSVVASTSNHHQRAQN